MASRRLVNVTDRTSEPSMRTDPAVTSCSRGISDKAVDLPPPDGPTRATVCPDSASKLSPDKATRPSG